MTTTKASADFGLYKEKKKPKLTVKLVLVLICTLLVAFGVFSVIMHLLNSGAHLETNFENTLENPTKALNAEKLISAASVKFEVQNLPPKPFGVTYRGQPPSEFTSTTEKITTLIYPPQLSLYRHRYYPKNIQDVIGAAAKSPHLQYKQAPSQYQFKNFTTYYHDPFYLYKPQDPSDINLLATSSVRFAPPIWSNLKNPALVPRFYPQHIPIHQYEENTNRQEVYNRGYMNPQKPITLTLNIYPNSENHGNYENRIEYKPGLKQIIRSKLENLQGKLRLPKKMVIHLNLYPDLSVAGESKMVVKKVERVVKTTTTTTEKPSTSQN